MHLHCGEWTADKGLRDAALFSVRIVHDALYHTDAVDDGTNWNI